MRGAAGGAGERMYGRGCGDAGGVASDGYGVGRAGVRVGGRRGD